LAAALALVAGCQLAAPSGPVEVTCERLPPRICDQWSGPIRERDVEDYVDRAEVERAVARCRGECTDADGWVLIEFILFDGERVGYMEGRYGMDQ
jgi:hypothetical protein